MLIPLLLMYGFRQKFKSNGMGLGLIVSVLLLFAIQWQHVDRNIYTKLSIFLNSISVFILSFLFIKFSKYYTVDKYKNRFIVTWPGIYLGILQLSFLIYFLFRNVSSLIPGTAWLFLSVIILEIAFFVRLKRGRKLMNKSTYLS